MKEFKTQPIRVLFTETEQPMRNREILLLQKRELSLVRTQQGYLKKRIKQKVKVSTINRDYAKQLQISKIKKILTFKNYI